ncbi:hypothetical protein [Candidatus Cardinium hertigii]|uniref:Uncharacterized protein n=1 Tax=Candidatus Cardinium hertigii TaxID=247481 RepID=A0A3N2QDG0_9BACT|nr:hypothetical protein [Candidatus Cardinium hertigii]ROT47845.1 hypothetical protein EDM02_00125 [Candidatus Cardinium hertigii]
MPTDAEPVELFAPGFVPIAREFGRAKELQLGRGNIGTIVQRAWATQFSHYGQLLIVIASFNPPGVAVNIYFR